MTASTSAPRRHPIRGAIYGLVLGLGLAFIFIGRQFANLDSIVPLLLVVVGIGIGVAWSMFGPAKEATPPSS